MGNHFGGNFTKSAFCDVTKLRNAGLPMVPSQMDQIAFSRIRGIVEKGWSTCTCLLPQVALISSTKPISSSISLLKHSCRLILVRNSDK